MKAKWYRTVSYIVDLMTKWVQLCRDCCSLLVYKHLYQTIIKLAYQSFLIIFEFWNFIDRSDGGKQESFENVLILHYDVWLKIHNLNESLYH